MSHDAAEHGIHVTGAEHWEPGPEHCTHVDQEHGGCTLPPEHPGDHKYAHDPLEDVEDPVEAFIEENER